jgi:hypothetical protein
VYRRAVEGAGGAQQLSALRLLRSGRIFLLNAVGGGND